MFVLLPRAGVAMMEVAPIDDTRSCRRWWRDPRRILPRFATKGTMEFLIFRRPRLLVGPV